MSERVTKRLKATRVLDFVLTELGYAYARGEVTPKAGWQPGQRAARLAKAESAAKTVEVPEHVRPMLARRDALAAEVKRLDAALCAPGGAVMTTTTPDGRTVRLVPHDGPPREPGSYLTGYTSRFGDEHFGVREVLIDGSGNLDYGPSSARVVWLFRIETIASGDCTAGIAVVDGDAIGQRGGAGVAEPSTPGREVADRTDPWTLTTVSRADLAMVLDERDELRARVAALEADRRWVPVGERLPDEGATVEVFGPHVRDVGQPSAGGWRGDHWYLSETGSQCDCDCAARGVDGADVTHWRPLGAGPEVQP